jgi:hypothetical protein
MQTAYMGKDAAITIRLPASVKRRLESRASSQHRSLSAQVVAELEQVSQDHGPSHESRGRFLGTFAGTAVPADRDIAKVRRLLWGTLGRHGERS